METLVAIEGSEKSKLEGTSAIVITCSDSSKQIADPVVYKLARVEGDGRLVPATDDEVMEVEDLLDDKSSVHFVLDTCQPAVCASNHETFGQEFMPMSIDSQGLFKVKDPCTLGGGSDTVFGTTVDLGKLNSQFEEIGRSVSIPVDGKIEESGDRKGSVESEPSTSTMCVNGKPDFSKLKGEICLDNLSVRELHATFKATFGRETSVKDKQWLKRRISMGLSNSCDVSTTTFIIENNIITKKPKVEEDCKDNSNLNIEKEKEKEDAFVISVGQSQSVDNHNHNHNHNHMEDDKLGGSSKSVKSGTTAIPKHHHMGIGSEDDKDGGKRVRKPTKRYIEVSESESRDSGSGRLVSSVKSSGHGPRTRVRPLHNIQPVTSATTRPLVTRQDSLGGSGVEIPYVSRIRRGRPRENFMALMKFQSCGTGIAAKLVKTAHAVDEVENRELKNALPTGWVQLQQPVIKEGGGGSEQYSEEASGELKNDSEEGQMDSYDDVEAEAEAEEEEDSDDNDNGNNILTVPTAKGGMRRKHHRPWTLSEVVKLVEGVSRYGAGRWSEIKRIAFSTCSHRTPVDLKDKWRNLLRASFAQLPAEKGVQNSKKQSSIPIPAPILLRVRELAEMQSQVSPDLKQPLRFGGGHNHNSNSGSRNVNDIKSGFL
ncbi:uncharacterized protein LOC111910349 isoform X1 [Lactuca sativa]|uniref:uncharacterized protein LOC111910349 isoform X1 n=1 Tax=Lactuca sativa TaxID=4236 RepID=UPI000CB34F6B|nr:uncharacterized protein LOC111910349 isoform X1 [Lactuca sativa]XP_023761952.1 uncharacterized protein LOC111910349 isoform X1 [Lactuca sativa]